MVRVWHADLRVSLGRELRRHQERDDPRQVGLIGQDLQIEQHLDVLFERRWRPGGRPVDQRQLAVHLRFGSCDATLDIADRRQIVRQFGPVRRAEAILQP